MSEAKIKVVEDLPGVGPAIAEKLREAGYDTLEAIGTQAPGTLSDATGIGKESCSKFIMEARKAANIGSFLTGTELMEKIGVLQVLLLVLFFLNPLFLLQIFTKHAMWFYQEHHK